MWLLFFRAADSLTLQALDFEIEVKRWLSSLADVLCFVGRFRLLSASAQQDLGSVAHYDFFSLVDDFIEHCDDAAVFIAFALAFDLLPHSDGVANEGWLNETQAIQTIEGDHRVSRLTHSNRKPGRNRENERAVSDALFERASPGELLIRVDLVPISGDPREVDYVGLSYRSPGGHRFFADLEVLEMFSHRSLLIQIQG
jgi:hypothetical protein